MNTNLTHEINALRQMGEIARTPFCSDYISASRVLIGGVPCLYVYVDAYQLIRDHRGLPDARRGLGRYNWNVDKWESERRVVYCGPVSNKKLYRGIMNLARRMLARVEEQAKRMYPEGRREWVVRANVFPGQPSVKGHIERVAHRHQRRIRAIAATGA